ncbi:imm11 family protein [Vibrio diabolicus]|uniref:imm11 family protein n=1 Tax=Vibrio diabolicus TaxID=50719 RepID=UPI003751A468
MYFALISEDYYASSTNFTPVDNRESMYSTNIYHPSSSENPIIWQDLEGGSINSVGPIVDCGDLSVSANFAQMLMSFDPYGIEVYPSLLKADNGSAEGRYLIAVNNVIDVLDEEKSIIKTSPRSGKKLVHVLYLSEEKLKRIPLNKRIAFRVKGAETVMFFCEEFFNEVGSLSEFDVLRKAKVSTLDRAPKF